MATIALSAIPISPLYQNRSAELKVAEHPLSIRAADISLQQNLKLSELNEAKFSSIR